VNADKSTITKCGGEKSLECRGGENCTVVNVFKGSSGVGRNSTDATNCQILTAVSTCRAVKCRL
jgi:hypothetical protein